MSTLKSLSYKSILLSYIALCLLMLGITGIGYAYSISYVRHELIYSTNLECKELVTQINESFLQTHKICNVLSTNSDLLTLAGQKEPLSTEQLEQAVSLQRVMQEIDMQSNLYQNLFVYFPDSNLLVSEKTKNRTGDQDINFFCQYYGLSREDFNQIMSAENKLLYHTFDNNLVWFMNPILENGHIKAVIIAELSGTSLIKNTDTDRIVFLKTPNDSILQCTGSISPEDISLFPNELEEAKFISLGNSSYIGVSLSTQYFNWICYVATPASVFFSKLYPFVLIFLSELAAMFVVAVILSRILSKRTYISVENLMMDNQKLSEEISRKNILLEYQELILFFRQRKKELSPSAYAFLESKLGENPKEEYILTLIQHNAPLDYAMDTDHRNTNPEILILENCLNTCIFQNHTGFAIPIDQYHLVIINPEDKPNEVEHLIQDFHKLEARYQAMKQPTPCVIVGAVDNNYSRFPLLYGYLKDCLQYVSFWSAEGTMSQGIHYYGELIKAEDQEDISGYGPGILRLLHCLENENFREAYNELNLLYKSTFSHDQRYLKNNLYRMYGLIELLITSLDLCADEEERAFYQSLHYKEQLYRIQSLSELIQESRRIFEAIIDYKENKVTKKEPGWIKDITNYIDENYMQNDLSVSVLADKFGISVPHLSRSFKTEKQIGALEYIHRTRVEASKGMLKTDDSIKNIALQVGYLDTQAFTRAFKRYENMTPSQYRENIKK